MKNGVKNIQTAGYNGARTVVQLEIPQIPHNLFGPSAQISQLFGIYMFEKSSIHMSIVHELTYQT